MVGILSRRHSSEGLWETGTGVPDPDKPTIIEVLGGLREESQAQVDGDLVRLITGFSRQIRAWFEERRNRGSQHRRKRYPCDRVRLGGERGEEW